MNWSEKKILVTGADGFIGSHLTEMLVETGAEIKALSLYNSFNYWGWLEDLDCLDKIEVISGDIRDAHFCSRITENVDIIFHLASLISIPYSYIAPDSYVDTNIKGTLNICQAAQKNGCRQIIHTSTSEVYGTAQYVPIDENHPVQPQSPYSASKIGADAMALSFYNSFNLPLVVARPFNTYGPRQSARAIIPTIITQIASGSKEVFIGDLSPTRDLNYVEDICRGFLGIAETPDTIGQVINLGSNTEISMEELFTLIKKLMHVDTKFIRDEQRVRPVKSEVFRLMCDNTKANRLFGFKSSISLEEGLERTIRWFTDPVNLSKYKTGIYNV